MSTVAGFDYHTELIDGIELQKPSPRVLHGIVQARLIVELSNWAGQLNLLVLAEQEVLCREDRLIPDIVLVDQTTSFVAGGYVRAEDVRVAVEIMSPGQSFSDMLSKCERLRRADTRSCWVVVPKMRRAWTYDDFTGLPREIIKEFVFDHRLISLSALFQGLDLFEAKGAV